MIEVILGALVTSLNNKAFSAIIIPERRHYLRMLESKFRSALSVGNLEYTYNMSSMCFEFPNGSKIAFFSSEAPERLRGCRMNYVGIIDSDKMKDFDYLEKSIIYPATISTDGKIVKAYGDSSVYFNN